MDPQETSQAPTFTKEVIIAKRRGPHVERGEGEGCRLEVLIIPPIMGRNDEGDDA
jgi:hypothetical protein